MTSNDNDQVDKVGTNHDWRAVFTPGRLALTIGLCLLALYSEVIFGRHSFFYQDYGLFTYPVAHYTNEMFWRGEVPLWNPLNHSGVPFLAQWNTSVCYPLSLIYILLPLPWSLNLFGLGHLVLAGVGMYRLARHWTQNQVAGTLAGLSFSLGGLMLNCLLWTSNLAALSWQPLVILWVERAWQDGQRRRLALAALVGAMQMLAGAPEIVLFTWIILGGLWLGEVCHGKVALGASFRRLSATVMMVAGLSAAQLLPFLDLLLQSERDAASTAGAAWPMPLWGVLNFVVPQFHAMQSVLGTYQLHGQYWTKSYYVGIGILMLGLVGVWRVRQMRFWWLSGVAFGGVLLAFGTDGYVYAWLKQLVPAIGVARYPIKFVALPVFVLPLLAAYGFSSLHADATLSLQNRRRTGLALGIITAGLLLLAGVALWLAWSFPKPEVVWKVTWQSALGRMVFLISFTLVLVAFLRCRTARTSLLLALGLVVLVAGDLLSAGLRLHPTVSRRAFDPIELNMSVPPRLGEARAMVSQPAAVLLSRIRNPNPQTYQAGIRGALHQNNNLVERIPKVDGFASLQLREQAEVLQTLNCGSNEVAGPLARFLGVSQVIFPRDLFHWQARSNALPLITVGQQPVFANPEQTLKAVASDAFAPDHEVYLPSTAEAVVAATNSATARVTLVAWAAHRVQFTVEADAPVLAVIAQSFYHNWRAYVQDQPATIWRANYAFQAVEVPAGKHNVTLAYCDWAFRIGVGISGLTLGLVLMFLLRAGDVTTRNPTVKH